MNDPLKKYVNRHREDFDHLEPPQEMFSRIQEALKKEKAVPEKKKNLNVKYWSIAASLLFILSTGTYFLFNREHSKPQPEAKKTITFQPEEKPVEKSPATDRKSEENVRPVQVIPESRKIRSEKKKLAKTERKEVNTGSDTDAAEKAEILHLLADGNSASSRISAMIKANALKNTDRAMLEILRKTATEDPNSNVRLAAVEAMVAHAGQPYAAENIAEAFIRQDDAVVQAELISIISNMDQQFLNGKVKEKIEALARNPATLAFVKDEAYAALMKND